MNEIDKLKTALADHYTIERELGAGGMALVYLARDVKHDRKVALKVLRPELAAVIGAERFLAEIKTTAGLQHQHILPLHDSGEVDGTVFYVMPYVEGDTLREKLNREKQLPIDDAVQIAAEVADALDYAHRQGIIHRDIKPENILIHDDSALVVDFGIALAAAKTGESRMTETGMSLGTPHYMSPEQAMGERDLDARTDIYALGCVLYEMLTGEPPFSGATAQAIVAKVMTEDPLAITKTRRNTPRHVENAAFTAMEKLPADRFATAAQFAEALLMGGQLHGATRTFRQVSPVAKSTRGWQVALAVVALIALFGWLRPSPEPLTIPPSRLAVSVPNLGGASTGFRRQIALNPDGSALFFTATTPDAENRTMRRELHESEATVMQSVLPYLAGYVFSQDGTRFYGVEVREGQAYTQSLSGRSARLFPSETLDDFVAWDSEGNLWVSQSPQFGVGIARVDPDGVLTYPFGSSVSSMALMQILPGDKKALAVDRILGTTTGSAFLVDLNTGESESLLDIPMVEIRYTAGYLIYVTPVTGTGALEAVRFDPESERILGSPIEIANDVMITGTGIAQFAVAQNGTVAYVPDAGRSLVLVDRDGSERDLLSEFGSFHGPMFSPDGRKISTDFFSVGGRDVWVYSLEDGVLSRATFDQDGHDAVWTPDGNFLTYLASVDDTLMVFLTRPGSGERTRLNSDPRNTYTGLWLSDMSGLVTVGAALNPGSGTDIALMTDGGAGLLEPIVATRFDEQFPAVSPDNRWIAYASRQSGRDEVYVRRIDGGDVVQVSTDGGMSPAWSPATNELFYRGTGEATPGLIAVSYEIDPEFSVTGRETLFSMAHYVTTNPHRNYDVSPDGRQFVAVKMNPLSRVVVIQNLPGLIEKLSGTERP